jgi:hypothetical protein
MIPRQRCECGRDEYRAKRLSKTDHQLPGIVCHDLEQQIESRSYQGSGQSIGTETANPFSLQKEAHRNTDEQLRNIAKKRKDDGSDNRFVTIPSRKRVKVEQRTANRWRKNEAN